MAKNFDNHNFVINFNKKSIVMKGKVGAPARMESFYQRDREVNAIIERIEDGNNIQITAPRRVGKTSILFSFLDKKISGHIYVYVDTESIEEEEDFYKKLLKEILKTDEIKNSQKLKSLWEKGTSLLSKIKSIKIVGNGIDFHDREDDVSFKEDLENLLCGMELEGEKKLILMVDEFPQTIQNIIDRGKGDLQSAKHFLQSNRDLRLHPKINGKVIFIYTGSIGLNHTVANIDASAFINDISPIEVGPLTPNESADLLNQLLIQKGRLIEPETTNYLLDKIEWQIPFHIQLAVQELTALTYDDKHVKKEIVDEAFNNIIALRNNNHFDHYYSRLKISFKGKAFDYVNELLETIAGNLFIDKGDIIDLAVKHDVQNDWKKIIEVLQYDGYVNNNKNSAKYAFNSPILRMWWQKYICK